MNDQSFGALVESLGQRSPTPGGGAAAAMAACMGTALLLMVVRFSRGKKQNVAREDDLARVEDLLQGHLQRLMPMAERDCAAFDQVSKAYAMPKATEAEQEIRGRAIQEAMVGAMVVPEEALCMVRDVCRAMSGVVDCVGKNIVSDLASASALLLAAGEGALLNVRVNAAYLTNRELADGTVVRAKQVLAEIRDTHRSIGTTVEKLLG
ncbi:MAG: cyclodeaminase/cyclohydrolase family protein [Planctomycetota bacterium]